MKLYALHTIHRKPDPDKDIEVILAKSVFNATQTEFDELEPKGAARKATADEIAIAKAKYAAKNAGQDEGFEEATSEPVSKPAAKPAKPGKPPKSDADI